MVRIAINLEQYAILYHTLKAITVMAVLASGINDMYITLGIYRVRAVLAMGCGRSRLGL
jgi:hypothetical protein